MRPRRRPGRGSRASPGSRRPSGWRRPGAASWCSRRATGSADGSTPCTTPSLTLPDRARRRVRPRPSRRADRADPRPRVSTSSAVPERHQRRARRARRSGMPDVRATLTTLLGKAPTSDRPIAEVLRDWDRPASPRGRFAPSCADTSKDSTPPICRCWAPGPWPRTKRRARKTARTCIAFGEGYGALVRRLADAD